MKKALNINSKSLRLIINNNLLNNNKIVDSVSNTNSEKICKWDYKKVSFDNFLNVRKLAEKSIMGTILRNVLVNVSNPDIIIFEPIMLPNEYKEHFFPDDNLKVFIGNC